MTQIGNDIDETYGLKPFKKGHVYKTHLCQTLEDEVSVKVTSIVYTSHYRFPTSCVYHLDPSNLATYHCNISMYIYIYRDTLVGGLEHVSFSIIYGM